MGLDWLIHCVEVLPCGRLWSFAFPFVIDLLRDCGASARSSACGWRRSLSWRGRPGERHWDTEDIYPKHFLLISEVRSGVLVDCMHGLAWTVGREELLRVVDGRLLWLDSIVFTCEIASRLQSSYCLPCQELMG